MPEQRKKVIVKGFLDAERRFRNYVMQRLSAEKSCQQLDEDLAALARQV